LMGNIKKSPVENRFVAAPTATGSVRQGVLIVTMQTDGNSNILITFTGRYPFIWVSAFLIFTMSCITKRKYIIMVLNYHKRYVSETDYCESDYTDESDGREIETIKKFFKMAE